MSDSVFVRNNFIIPAIKNKVFIFSCSTFTRGVNSCTLA